MRIRAHPSQPTTRYLNDDGLDITNTLRIDVFYSFNNLLWQQIWQQKWARSFFLLK